METTSLFARLGGADRIQTLVADIVAAHLQNPLVAPRLAQDERSDMASSIQHAFEFFASGTGGPIEYTGRDLRSVRATGIARGHLR